MDRTSTLSQSLKAICYKVCYGLRLWSSLSLSGFFFFFPFDNFAFLLILRFSSLSVNS